MSCLATGHLCTIVYVQLVSKLYLTSRLLLWHVFMDFPAVPRNECFDVELPFASIVIHEPNLAEHRPLRPALIMNSANGPHATWNYNYTFSSLLTIHRI